MSPSRSKRFTATTRDFGDILVKRKVRNRNKFRQGKSIAFFLTIQDRKRG